MKIYFIVRNRNRFVNLFIPEIVEELERLGHQVSVGTDLLFREELFLYDIVHIHWPEYMYDGNLTYELYDSIEKRIIKIKQEGIPIVLHCHNLKPHTNKNQYVLKLYALLYSQADAVIHMGSYSKNLLEKEYPTAKHVLIPHHIYNKKIFFNKPVSECKKELDIKDHEICILCFGEFRSDDERTLLLNCLSEFKNERFHFIAPGFYRIKSSPKQPIKYIRDLFKIIKYRKYGLKVAFRIVDNNKLETFFLGADVVLIQRKEILNSGNLPLAFAAGKVVVGPLKGNVGSILKLTGNPTFDPQNSKSVFNSIRKAVLLVEKGLGDSNRKYAYANWTTEVVVKKIEDLYKFLIDANNK